MIKKEHVHPVHTLSGPRDSGDNEVHDTLLGKRSSPPTDTTSYPNPPEELPSDTPLEISEQLDGLFKRAREVLEPQPRPSHCTSVLGLLKAIEKGEQPEDFLKAFGDSLPLDAAEPGCKPTVSLLGDPSSSVFYKLSERLIANFKWRPDGR